MKYISLLLSLLIFCTGVSADNFKVSEIIGSTIRFKGKNLKVGDIINDELPIALNNNNVLTLKNLNKSLKTYTISGSTYKKNKCKTFGEYFSSNVGTVTRDEKGNHSIRAQMDSVFIWVDNVTVPTMYPKNNSRVFAIEIIDGVMSSHTIGLPASDGGRSFALPQEIIFGDRKPYPLFFNLLVGIRDPETDEVSYERVVRNSILMPILHD